jgi:hypothetical protein
MLNGAAVNAGYFGDLLNAALTIVPADNMHHHMNCTAINCRIAANGSSNPAIITITSKR